MIHNYYVMGCSDLPDGDAVRAGQRGRLVEASEDKGACKDIADVHFSVEHTNYRCPQGDKH